MTSDRNAWRQGKVLDPFIAWFLACVAGLHVTLTLLIPDLPEKFQLGDRAWDRAAKLADILSAHDFNSVLSALYYHGAPGDYLFFLPAYAAFGPVGVITQNIVLLLIGVWFLYRIGMAWFSPLAAKIAVVAYVLLPATIFHPQVFATEAICNPLLVVFSWYAGRVLDADRPERRDVVLLGLVSAIVIFTRYLYLLLPLMIAGLLLLRGDGWRKSLRPITLCLALSYSLVLIWSGVAALNNGRYEVGFNFQGLGSNLYLRAERMDGMGGLALDPAVKEQRTMTVGQFALNAVEQPLVLMRTVISDAVNLVANPGAAMVYGRYFGLFDLDEASDKDTFKWRDIRDRDGTLAVIGYLWKISPAGMAINVVMAGFLGALYLGGMTGAWSLLRDGARPLAFRLLIVGIPVYILVFTFASGSVRWDHRSPLEFVLCLLFAADICATATWLRASGEKLAASSTHRDQSILS